MEPIPTENLWVQDVESELFTIIFESFAKSSPNKFTTCHWFILYWPSKGVMNRSSVATRTILTMSSKHVQVHAKWFQNHFLKTSVASKLLSPWSWESIRETSLLRSWETSNFTAWSLTQRSSSPIFAQFGVYHQRYAEADPGEEAIVPLKTC